jgi:hypothetical protein
MITVSSCALASVSIIVSDEEYAAFLGTAAFAYPSTPLTVAGMMRTSPPR